MVLVRAGAAVKAPRLLAGPLARKALIVIIIVIIIIPIILIIVPTPTITVVAIINRLCHIVQLAISQKKILGYLNGSVVPYQRSQSMVKEQRLEDGS